MLQINMPAKLCSLQALVYLQFLPQDKVVEFAKLKPKELLEETEKAIGDSSLYQKHVDLIQKRNQLKQVETASRFALLYEHYCSPAA